MNREDYLSDSSVQDFIAWMKPRLCSPGALRHSYNTPREGSFSFGSIYDAFQQYKWGRADFNQTSITLDCFAMHLKVAATANDHDGFRSACEDILGWGGVLPRNQARLEGLGSGIVSAFKRAAAQLDPQEADTKHLGNLQLPDTGRGSPAYLMNAGWSKIFSLMIPGFPMYDGRVGAALGLLSRTFCEEEQPPLKTVPHSLRFPWGRARMSTPGSRDRRNPSRGALRYVPFNGRALLQAEWNLKAAWLLGELCRHGCFGMRRNGLRALEAALFMIGYDVTQSTAAARPPASEVPSPHRCAPGLAL